MSRLLSRFTVSLAALSTISLTVLTGCGAATSFSNPTASAKVTGKIYGGQQPVSGSAVTVWAAGITGYGSAAAPLATTTSLSDGSFSFPDNSYTCTAGEQVYITASGGTSVAASGTNANIMLATGLGDCATAQTATVEINEVTTAVTAFALAQFFTPTFGSLSTDSFGTDPADLTAFTLSNQYTIPTLIDIPTGTVNPNTPSITIEAAKIYSIADTLAACVNDAAGFANCGTLYTNTTPSGGAAPTDTLQAAVQMALNPSQNVPTLYGLATGTPPFIGLSAAPNDWTIGVSYTTSTLGLGITGTATSATSASIDIDALGKIWIPTNLGGSTSKNLNGVAYFDPATATFNGPYLTGHFTQPQYVAIDSTGYAWLTDQASTTIGYVDTGGEDLTTPGGNGDLSVLPAPYVTLGPIAADDETDVLFSYIDSSGHADLALTGIGANLTQVSGVQFMYPPTGLATTDLYAYASTSGSSTPCGLERATQNDQEQGSSVLLAATSSTCTSGGLALGQENDIQLSSATSLNQFCENVFGTCEVPASSVVPFMNLPEGVATDGFGDEWIAMSGNGSVLVIGQVPATQATLSTGYLHNASNGNTATTPYAIAIDGSGNIWLANASCITNSATACVPTSFTLSEIIGAAYPTRTPLSAQMFLDGSLIGSRPGSQNTCVQGAARRTHPLGCGDVATTSGAGAHPSPMWGSAPGKSSAKPLTTPSGKATPLLQVLHP